MLKNEDTKRKVDEWKVDIKIDPKLYAHCNKCIDMTSNFESVWDCPLSRDHGPKHHIELKSEDSTCNLGTVQTRNKGI